MGMRKRSRKPQEDADQIAQSIMQAIASGDVPSTSDGKNPFAVALGRKGGLKGGKARAAGMTAKERSDSAKRAAQARWSGNSNQGKQ
jgi:hypothetical protein